MAEREIKTRIVLEGEQQFRQAMNNASSAVKALNAEEKACEAQFKATGDAEAYREEKTRILTEKLQEQQKAVEAAKKAVEQLTKQGVEKNDRAMMTWRTKLANAQTAVANTQAKLQGLQGSLDSASQAMDNGAQAAADYGAQLEAIGGVVNVEGAINSIDRITDTVKGAVKTVAGLGKKVWDLEADAAHWADDVITSATKTGLDVETYQAWDYAAQMVDTSIDEIIQAQTRMNNKVLKESPEVAKALGQVGVAFRDRDQSDVFWDTIRALHSMEDVTKRNNAAQQIFGNNYRNLLPLINKGADAWDAAVAEARENYVLNADQVGQLGDLDDSLVKLGASLDKTKMTVLAELAPTFSELAGSMAQAVNAFNDFLATEEGQQMITDLGNAIGSLAKSFLDPGPEGFKHAVETAKNLLKGVTDALKWLDKNKDGVKVALGVIAGGFAVFETAKGILNLIEAGKAVKNLFAARKITPTSGANNTGLQSANSNGNGTTPSTGSDGGAPSVVPTGTPKTAPANPTPQTPATPAAPKKIAPTKLPGGWAADMAGGFLTEAAVVVAALTPAYLGQKDSEKRAVEEKEAAEAALENLLEKNGTDENSDLIKAANKALGPQRDANGEYQRDFTGLFINMASSGESGDILMGLQERKNAQRAELESTLRTYGRPVSGYDPWLMLQRVWDPRFEKEDWEDDWRFTQGELDELLTVIRDAYLAKGNTPPQPMTPTPQIPSGVIDRSSEEWAQLMGLRERSDQQLNELHNALMRQEGGADAWDQLLNLWESNSLTTDQVQRLYDTLTQADSTIIETAARRAAEEAAKAAEDARIQAELDKLLGLNWRKNQELGQMMGTLFQIAGGDTVNDLLALWGGRKFSPEKIDELYNTVFGTLEHGFNYAGAAAGEEFTKAADAAAGETAGQATGAAFAAGVIKGIDANMAALSAAASRMGAVMSQGIVAAGGVYGGGYSGVGVYGASGGVLSQSGIDAKIYMGRKVVGTMVADTVNRVMGAKVSAARR